MYAQKLVITMGGFSSISTCNKSIDTQLIVNRYKLQS